MELRVAPGSYTIAERSVPEPYYVSDTPTQTVSLNSGDEKEVRFENQKKPLLTLTKRPDIWWSANWIPSQRSRWQGLNLN